MHPIENWKSLLPPDKAANLKIADYSEIGDVLRVDLETIPEFTPRMSARQNKREDATIPRVCVCTSLMGCIAGYASFYHDFDIGSTDGKWTLSGIRYRGGMYIHRIPYEKIALPGDKLAGDSSISGEMWLVNYDAEHASYPSELIGKVFIHEFTSRRLDEGGAECDYTIYLEVTKGNMLKLTPSTTLGDGYWKLRHRVRRDGGKVKINQDPFIAYDQVSEQEYQQVKGMGIGLLNDRVQPAQHW